MELSVVIPCHGGVKDTRACLRALAAQRAAPPMEVLLVDNDSPDATPQLGREFTGVRVLRQHRNLGFAEGVNAGLAEARGEWLMVLNNDAMPAPHMIRRLLDAILQDSRIGLAAPVSNRVKGQARLPVGDAGGTDHGRMQLEDTLARAAGGRLQDVETLAGLCLLFHRRLLTQIGNFDGRFGLGNFEDDDFCLRARLAGHRLVIARDAFVHHAGMRTFHALGLDYDAELCRQQRIFRDKWQTDPAGAAHLAWRDGRGADAARHAAAALGAHPSWPDALLLLGREAAAAGRHGDAASHLRAYLASCPLHSEAVALLALQILSLGEEAGARRLLTWALGNCHFEADQVASILEQWSRWHLARGRSREAGRALATAFAIDPDRASLHNLLGVAQMQSGQISAAVGRLQRALELGSEHAHTNLGICFWQRGDRERAVSHFTAALRDNPGDPLARSNLDRAVDACRVAGVAQA